ncbi:hypothetical protein FRX31_021101, partial [Thalictrum thalictroides]
VNRDNDITLDVLYCGIRHSDLHSIKNEWNNAVYPIVPGTQYGPRKFGSPSDASHTSSHSSPSDFDNTILLPSINYM